MHEIRSNNGAVGYRAGLSFATLEQTASSGVNHLGRSVAVAPQPVVLELGNLSPPGYSEIDRAPPAYSEIGHAPPPSYQEVTRQINQPLEEESSSIADWPEDDSADRCWKRFKDISLICLAGGCVAFATYIIFR